MPDTIGNLKLAIEFGSEWNKWSADPDGYSRAVDSEPANDSLLGNVSIGHPYAAILEAGKDDAIPQYMRLATSILPPGGTAGDAVRLARHWSEDMGVATLIFTAMLTAFNSPGLLVEWQRLEQLPESEERDFLQASEQMRQIIEEALSTWRTHKAHRAP